MYLLWSCDKYMHQYIPNTYQDIEHYCPPEISLMSLIHPLHHSLETATVLTFFHHKLVFSALNLHINGLIEYAFFCASFTQHNILKLHLRCCTYQYCVLFYFRVEFHYMNKLPVCLSILLGHGHLLNQAYMKKSWCEHVFISP